MKIAITSIAAMAALAMALTVLPSTPVAAQMQTRDANSQAQHPDYSKNKFYAVGNREGYEDYQKKTQRPEHTHNYRDDNDRAAHDYGYKQGLQGQRGYHPDPKDHQ